MLSVVIVLSYLLGSVPSSIIAGKLLRASTSGTMEAAMPAATNTFRILGWKPGILVTAADVFKGLVATLWVAPLAFGALPLDHDTTRLIAGVMCIVGHIWTIFAGFRGGKGVGTAAGVLVIPYPIPLMVCLAVFLGVLAIWRIVALSSIAAALAFPVVLSILINTDLIGPWLIRFTTSDSPHPS
jgi:glycerol-3-phosphate acyltransferase PlsY